MHKFAVKKEASSADFCAVALTMISGKRGSVFFLLFLHGEKKHTGFLIRPG